MKLRFAERAGKDYARLPVIIRKAFGKQLHFLLLNRNHPSLHAKKYNAAQDIWQGATLVALVALKLPDIEGDPTKKSN